MLPSLFLCQYLKPWLKFIESLVGKPQSHTKKTEIQLSICRLLVVGLVIEQNSKQIKHDKMVHCDLESAP